MAGTTTSNGSSMIVEVLSARRTLMSVPELAELTGQSDDSIYRATKSGKIPHLKFGAKIKFDPKELVKWVEEHHVR